MEMHTALPLGHHAMPALGDFLALQTAVTHGPPLFVCEMWIDLCPGPVAMDSARAAAEWKATQVTRPGQENKQGGAAGESPRRWPKWTATTLNSPTQARRLASSPRQAPRCRPRHHSQHYALLSPDQRFYCTVAAPLLCRGGMPL